MVERQSKVHQTLLRGMYRNIVNIVKCNHGVLVTTLSFEKENICDINLVDIGIKSTSWAYTYRLWIISAVTRCDFSSDFPSNFLNPICFRLISYCVTILVESRMQSLKVDWKSDVRPNFNRLSGENHDFTLTFSHI